MQSLVQSSDEILNEKGNKTLEMNLFYLKYR